jgi:hypothetical protein
MAVSEFQFNYSTTTEDELLEAPESVQELLPSISETFKNKS